MAKLLSAPESPAKLASTRQVIEISEQISEFPRLSEALEQDLGQLETAQRPAQWQTLPVTGRLRFDFADAQSEDVTVEVEATTVVPLVCQRCLEPFEKQLEADTRLLLVQEADHPGREGLENWELEEDLLRPIDLVDELLVMAMPFAAKHAGDADCGAVAEEAAAPEETVRPFADLKAQLKAARKPDEPE
jgi:uncharacterized metal-binding protein YceD (DUF177 family)